LRTFAFIAGVRFLRLINPKKDLFTMPYTKLRPAIFLDRDGTLNIDKDYLYKCEDWEWIDGVVPSLARLSRAGFALVVASNQSGIARGFYTEKDVKALHKWVDDELFRLEGIRFDGFYICPHHPDYGSSCECRKPAHGLLLRAADELQLDLSSSWMIGDKARDVEAGRRAGCRTALVSEKYQKILCGADISVSTFTEAVNIILEQKKF